MGPSPMTPDNYGAEGHAFVALLTPVGTARNIGRCGMRGDAKRLIYTEVKPR